jgi:hypothetical protein
VTTTDIKPMIHVTQVKRALRTLLIEQLPIVLQIADISAHDGVTTPVPVSVFTSEKYAAEGYPSLELIATSSKARSNSAAQMVEHSVVVGFTLTGDDEERLTVQVERYMWAIRQIARDTLFQPEPPTGPIDTIGEQYTPLLNKPAGVESPFVKGGFLNLLITTVE